MTHSVVEHNSFFRKDNDKTENKVSQKTRWTKQHIEKPISHKTTTKRRQQ